MADRGDAVVISVHRVSIRMTSTNGSSATKRVDKAISLLAPSHLLLKKCQFRTNQKLLANRPERRNA